MRLKGRDGSIGFIRICSCEEQGEPNLFRNFCWFSPFFVVALDESSFACHRKLGFSRWSSAPINESVAILSNRCCWCCIKAYLCEQIIDSTIEPSFAAKVHSCHNIAAIPERQCYRQQHDNSGSGKRQRRQNAMPFNKWPTTSGAMKKPKSCHSMSLWRQLMDTLNASLVRRRTNWCETKEHTNKQGKEECCRLVSSAICQAGNCKRALPDDHQLTKYFVLCDLDMIPLHGLNFFQQQQR